MSERSRDEDVPETERGGNRPGRTPNQVGETGRSDIGAEGLADDMPQGRGAIAYGGRGDAGAVGGGLGGKGRGTEGGAFEATGGRSGGAGGLGRGTEGISRGGGQSSELRPPADAEGDDAEKPRRGPVPDVSKGMADIGRAGGAGGLAAEEQLADSGLTDQGGTGRESQSTEGDESLANESGTSGGDRPADDGRAA